MQQQQLEDTKEFRLKLVASIQKIPSLWDKKDPAYGQRSGYWDKWQQIAASLGDGVSATIARRRWRYLCQTYQKYLIAQATGNSRVGFELAKPMEFMAPHIEVTVHVDRKETMDYRDQDSDEDEEEDSYSSETGDGEQDLKQEQISRARTGCNHLAVDASNADALFLLSMLPVMSRMSDELKRNFKIEVMELGRRFNDGN